MKTMRPTREKIELIIPRSEFRSDAALVLDRYPVRSLALVLVLLVGAGSLDNSVVWLVFLVLGTALVIGEVWNTRDYVTKTHVIRQRGILGRSRRAIPLCDVSAVTLRRPGFPELPSHRDLEVHGDAEVFEFLCVKNAEVIAHRIKILAEQARADAVR